MRTTAQSGDKQNIWYLLVLGAASAVALFSRFLKGGLFSTMFEDDFFYYVQIAKHLAFDHISSFDGIHMTNGYHPLWLLLLTALYRLFPGISFFIAVEAVGMVAVFAFYFAAVRCFTNLRFDARLVRLAALSFSLHALLLFRFGMEVTLALPLAFWTLAYILSPEFRWTTLQSIFYGLMASLTILARLDMILLFALLLLAQIWRERVPAGEWARRLGLFSLGGFLLAVYLASNEFFFRTLLPISGTAKQLKPKFPPSTVPIIHFIVHPDFTKAAFAYPAIVVGLIGGILVARRKSADRPILVALLLFPIVHLTELCLLSDWHIWPWYYYSLSFATFTGMVLLRRQASEAAVRSKIPALAMYAVSGFLCLYMVAYSMAKRPPAFAILGEFVAKYASEHPGVYAMGDCAGSAGYYSTSPVIQLEGLVMDKSYLSFIRARTPLADVLAKYGADYYATIQNPVNREGCFNVVEPKQAGPASPVMRGRICAAPVASTVYGGVSVGIYRASDVLLR